LNSGHDSEIHMQKRKKKEEKGRKKCR
jgi:hypothetical protein